MCLTAPVPNGTAVANTLRFMGLRFPEFGAQLIARTFHQWVAVSTALVIASLI